MLHRQCSPQRVMALGRTIPYRVVTGNTRYAFMLVSCVLIGVVLIVHIRTTYYIFSLYMYVLDSIARTMPRSKISPGIYLIAKAQGNQVVYFLVSCTIV